MYRKSLIEIIIEQISDQSQVLATLRKIDDVNDRRAQIIWPYLFMNQSIPEITIKSEIDYFILRLYAIHKQGNDYSVCKKQGPKFIEALRSFRLELDNSTSLDNRVSNLLMVSNFKTFKKQLLGLFNILKDNSEELVIDYVNLQNDLYNLWGKKKTSQEVRVQWAKQYYKIDKGNNKTISESTRLILSEIEDKPDVLASLRISNSLEDRHAQKIWPYIFKESRSIIRIVPSERAMYSALKLYAIHQQGKQDTVYKPIKDEGLELIVALAKVRNLVNNPKSFDVRLGKLLVTKDFVSFTKQLSSLVKIMSIVASSNTKIDYAILASNFCKLQESTNQARKVIIDWGIKWERNKDNSDLKGE